MTNVSTAALLPTNLHQMMTLGSGMVSGPKRQQSLLDCRQSMELPYPCWSSISFMYFFFADGESSRLPKNTEVELIMEPWPATSIRITSVILPFLTRCSRRSSYFSILRWRAPHNFPKKGRLTQWWNIFNLTKKWQYPDAGSSILFQSDIMKWCSKSFAMYQDNVHTFTRKFRTISFYKKMNHCNFI